MVFRRYHSPVNLSTRERQLITTLVVLLIVLATFQLLADLTEVLSRVADVVIIFVAAWAVSYLLSPLVTRIDQRTMLNRPLSVVVVYIGIAFLLAGTLALAVPGLVSQLNDLIVRAPEYGDRAAQEVVALQHRLEGAGLPVNVTDLYGQVPAKLSQIAGTIAADALGYVSATASVLFNFTLVLIIAFIMLIDRDRHSPDLRVPRSPARLAYRRVLGRAPRDAGRGDHQHLRAICVPGRAGTSRADGGVDADRGE